MWTWYRLDPATSHFFNDIWSKGSENDIRNSEYNIIRDVRIDNPESPAFGQWLVKDGYYKQLDSIRQWYPLMTKISRVNNFPEEFYQKDANGNPLMTPFGEHLVINSANGSYKERLLVPPCRNLPTESGSVCQQG